MSKKPGKKQRTAQDWEISYVENQLPWDTDVPDLHLVDIIKKYGLKSCSAIDIGCGTGTNSIWLAKSGFNTTGVDISKTAIEMALDKAKKNDVNCNFLTSDFLNDPVDKSFKSFGFAYDRGCFHSVLSQEDKTQFVTNLAKLLDINGIWLSLIGSTDGPYGCDPRPPRRSALEVISVVEPKFEILELSTSFFDQERFKETRAWVLVAKKRSEI